MSWPNPEKKEVKTVKKEKSPQVWDNLKQSLKTLRRMFMFILFEVGVQRFLRITFLSGVHSIDVEKCSKQKNFNILKSKKLQAILNTTVNLGFLLLSVTIFFPLRASLANWTDYFMAIIGLHF